MNTQTKTANMNFPSTAENSVPTFALTRTLTLPYTFLVGEFNL